VAFSVSYSQFKEMFAMPCTINDILNMVDKMAPFKLQEEWDNSGLILGDPSSNVKGIAVTLDLAIEVIDKACNMNINTIITHHPPVISPMKRWDVTDYTASLLCAAARHDINLIAAHTNLDVSYNGINVTLAQLINLLDFKPLHEGQDGAFGLGAVGCLEDEISRQQLAKLLNEKWNVSWVRFYGSRTTFKRIALCGGSGGELWKDASNFGADIFITADMKYHQIIEAQRYLTIAIVDHGEMERSGLFKFIKDLQRSLAIQVHDLTDIKPYVSEVMSF